MKIENRSAWDTGVHNKKYLSIRINVCIFCTWQGKKATHLVICVAEFKTLVWILANGY